MKIVILTHYFPPDSPGWIPHDLASGLAERGHMVRVLTSFPHYDTGKIARGYRQRLKHTEVLGKISVRRVPIFPSHSSNAIGRIVNYVSFSWSARTAKSFVRDADVIYVHGTPATVAAPARAWSKSLRIPYVFHVQDIWPESVTESGFLPRPISAIAGKLISRWLGILYSQAAAVNAIAPTAREMLIQRGVPKDKCHLVYNWSDESVQSRRSFACRPSNDRGLEVIYAGNLGVFQDLETVVMAAGRFGDRPGFRLRIAGSGIVEDRLRQLVKNIGASDHIEFVGRLNQDEMAAFYASADFQVISLKDRDFFSSTIPSKFQSGLVHGLPVITTVKGDVTRLVNEHNLGFTALPGDVESLANALDRAYATSSNEREEFSRRALAFYRAYMSRSIALDRIESILTNAAKRHM